MYANTITLWFGDEINEAASWYLKSIPGATCDTNFDATAKGNLGDMITLVLPGGLHITLLNGGSPTEKNRSISIVLMCQDQAEIDQVWDALTADGGSPGKCGWLVDKFGFHWQVVPEQMKQLMSGKNLRKIFAALRTMDKIDIAQLQAAGADE